MYSVYSVYSVYRVYRVYNVYSVYSVYGVYSVYCILYTVYSVPPPISTKPCPSDALASFSCKVRTSPAKTRGEHLLNLPTTSSTWFFIIQG